MTESPALELPPDIAAALARVDDLVEKFDMHPDPTVRDRVIALLNNIDMVHRAGLRAMLDVVAEVGATQRALANPLVRMLVDLYDLETADARVSAVLESIREHVEGHGGQVQIISAGVDAVHLSVASRGHTCDGMALREVAERELREQMPDLSVIVVDDADPPVAPGNFVPLTSLRLRRAPTLVWHSVLPATELSSGCTRGIVIDDVSVLIANLEGRFVAYHNRCPGSLLPLHGGTLEGEVLVCPWHRCRFDLREGRRLDERRAGLAGSLERIAVDVEDGEVRIGLPVRDAP